MKTKILLGISFLFYFAETALSCRSVSYLIGKIYIVDENNKPIQNARLWRFISADDSFSVNQYYRDTPTLNLFGFWYGARSYSSIKNAELKNKCILVQAQGYCDVVITSLSLEWKKNERTPILYIHMYTSKYLKKGDMFTLLNKYICEKEVTVKDSLHLKFEDYNQSLRSENAVESALRTSVALVKTYPNPVLDKLNIEINSVITKPYRATLTDIQGRTINEMELENSRSILDMQWEAKGMYFIQVYNPEGVLLYSLKFLKS